jgi:hypothetical protein
MRVLLLGARGAVGRVVRRELAGRGHTVTPAGRSATGPAGIDLTSDLAPLAELAAAHDVVVNGSGVERSDLATATGPTPLVDISATGAYLEALRAHATGPVVLGAGLVPGLSTIMVRDLHARADDDVDVLVMLGSGERHGPAAVAWTAGLVGTDVHRPPEGGRERNLLERRRAAGPDRRTRRYLRADFPDHVLLGGPGAPRIRSYLALSSAPMTAALALIGRVPTLRGVLAAAPHIGSDDWHVIARNRRTRDLRQAAGSGQSEATGRLTALAAERVLERGGTGAMTMADLVSLDDALTALRTPSPVEG